MVLKLYCDLLTQPSRALFIFFKKAGIPFEMCPVDFINHEQRTNEFKRNLNKFQRVPFIHHDDFRLAESIAIFRYITREFNVADHWYPKDSKRRAEVDVYLEWQHLNVRFFCGSYSRLKRLDPIMKNREPNMKVVKSFESGMMKNLKQFQEYFLENATFICGKVISYSDLAAACEIEQPRITGYDPRDDFPKIKNWLEAVRKECNPFYDEAHATVYEFEKNADKSTSKQKLMADIS